MKTHILAPNVHILMQFLQTRPESTHTISGRRELFGQLLPDYSLGLPQPCVPQEKAEGREPKSGNTYTLSVPSWHERTLVPQHLYKVPVLKILN